MSWDRDLSWRQGSILRVENFSMIGLPVLTGIDLALAVSHDCDIAHNILEDEPIVEFVLGKIMPYDQIHHNYEYAKNPRKLHLTAQKDGLSIGIELQASPKYSVEKEILVQHSPDKHFILDSEGYKILQSWLSIRYRRHAFPDELNNRLKPIFDFLVQKSKTQISGIIGYWVDFDPQNAELTDGQAYEFWITIVYKANDVAVEKAAKELAIKLREKIQKLPKNSIDLRYCEAVSATEFTLHDQLTSMEYKLEYLSHRTSPTGPFII